MELNEMLDIMSSVSQNDHYLNRYFSLVESHMDEDYNGEVFHRHHILPQSIFPEYKKSKWNIISISPRLHLILHWCLHYAIGKSMTHAYFQMCIHPKYDLTITPKQYQTIKEAHSYSMSKKVWCYIGDSLRRLNPNDVRLVSGEATIVDDLTKLPHVESQRGKARPDKNGMCAAVNSISGEVEYVPTSLLQSNESYESRQMIYIPCGRLRDADSRNKTGDSLRGRIHCYDPSSGKRKFIKEESAIPEGWEFGYPPEWHERQSMALTGKEHYYNPETGETGRFKQDEVPYGWTKGRRKFDNVFSGKAYLVNQKTKEGILIEKDENSPRYCTNRKVRTFYVFDDGNIKIFSGSVNKLIDAVPEDSRVPTASLINNSVHKVYQRGKFKGMSLYEVGFNKIAVDEWDYSDDKMFKWIG